LTDSASRSHSGPGFDPARRLPPVHRVLAEPIWVRPEALAIPPTLRTAAIRQELEALRTRLRAGNDGANPVAEHEIQPVWIAQRAWDRLERGGSQLEVSHPILRPVLNASGVLLHTGLGRAPLAAEAIAAIARTAGTGCDLEFDLVEGRRGERGQRIAALINRLTGAEASLVVNNNAAATILTLGALAKDREVIVSRGQLVEIGGAFRLPEIFEVSGARLVEVGTTNKTRLSDYERAITERTAGLLRVHTGNYQIVGFTETVGIAELAELGRSRGIWTIDDIGSGRLNRHLPPGLPQDCEEPTLCGSLQDGADLVLCSTDKLLGGPQGGLVVGRADLVERLKRHPLARAFRVDKLTLAALEATLDLIALWGPSAPIPLWRFLSVEPSLIKRSAEALAHAWAAHPGWVVTVEPDRVQVGGGSLPGWELPSWSVVIARERSSSSEVEALAQALRRGTPAVLGRVRRGRLWLNPHGLSESEQVILRDVVAKVAVGDGAELAKPGDSDRHSGFGWTSA